jgi:hypothetical protein
MRSLTLNVDYYEEKVCKYISKEYEKLMFWAKFKFFFISWFKKVEFEYPSFYFRGIWDRDAENEEDNEFTRMYGNKGKWVNGNLNGPDWSIFVPFVTKEQKSENMVMVTEGKKFDEFKETVFPSNFKTTRPGTKDYKIGKRIGDTAVLIADDLTEEFKQTNIEITANKNLLRVSIICSN